MKRPMDILGMAVEFEGKARALCLDRVCRDDAALRAEVESLLEAHDAAGEFLGEPTHISPALPSESSGQLIGRYKLLQNIGEGGFGSVWMADQMEPVKRRVALKIIKLGMDTKQVIARFEAERQALAMMDHPNIAKVLDAGSTDAGRPYFVMEYVKGVGVLEYCDHQKLDTPARLDLFAKVCHAIQHAHQKGIIHRDIKPSNILITLHDGVPVPKVIDFGIAKATNAELTNKTLFTQHRQMIGTPAYMSPEQAEMSGLDIDTRSDIYSLGVLLYELLTGTTPFDGKQLISAGFDGMLRMIRDEEPHKPSTRVSSLLSEPRTAAGSPPSAGSSAIEIARFRRTDPHSLSKHLRGDLDWIVMKCLEKDRTRRYETAAAVASDIQRHLEDQPVLAGPPTATYRFRKFARRNKAALITTTAVAAALIIGLSIGGTLLWREQARTLDALSDSQEARRAEEVQRRIAQAVNDFLTDDLLAAVAPSSRAGRGKDVSMREVLDEAAARIDKASRAGGRFEEMPLVEASIRATLGSTYEKLGEYAAAEPHLERALLLRDRELGEEHSGTLASTNFLALLYKTQGRYDEAEVLFVTTLKIKKRILGLEHSSTLGAMNNLAVVYDKRGHFDEAERLYSKTLEIQKRTLGEEHLDTLGTMNNLAHVYQAQGRYAEAEPLFVRALGLMRSVLGEEAAFTLNCMGNLAILYAEQGRNDEAEPLFVSALDIRKRVLGEEHPITLGSMNSLGNVYKLLGRHDEAEALFVKALDLRKRILGEKHPSTLASMGTLASLYTAQGRYDEAEPLLLETLGLMRGVLGEEALATQSCMQNLAILYKAQGRYEEATPLFVTALKIRKRVQGEGHPTTLKSMQSLISMYRASGRLDEAEALHLKKLEIEKRTLGEEHPNTLSSMYSLANLHKAQGRYDKAELLFVTVLEIRKRVQGEKHRSTLGAMHNLALVYYNQGRYDQAELLYVRALGLMRSVLGEEAPFTQNCMQNLATLYKAQGRYDEAEPLFVTVLEIRKRVLGAEHPATLTCMDHLASLHVKQGRMDDARPLVRALHEARRRRAERPQASPGDKNDFAWNLLTAEQADLRDPQAALRLARDACAMTGHANHNMLGTLALAQHLTGDTPAAIETEKKALLLLPQDAAGRSDYEAALARYEAALEEPPEPEEVSP